MLLETKLFKRRSFCIFLSNEKHKSILIKSIANYEIYEKRKVTQKTNQKEAKPNESNEAKPTMIILRCFN